jgi:hypothetical protein
MRKQREKANVSDGPPVEHSIMKRAWPYALALAVVVTGCYLALAPLLRSLNPGPTTSATRVLGAANTITVGSAKTISLFSTSNGSTQYASALPVIHKKTAKKAHKKVVVSSTTPDFATSTTSSNTTQSSGTSQSSTPPAKTSTTSTPKKSSKGSAKVVGGSAPQDDNAGLAGQTNGEDSVGGGTSSAVGP